MATVSLRAAINQKCKDCIYDQEQPGNWREQVTWCIVTECSLWKVRPRSKSGRMPPENYQNDRFRELNETPEWLQ